MLNANDTFDIRNQTFSVTQSNGFCRGFISE